MLHCSSVNQSLLFSDFDLYLQWIPTSILYLTGTYKDMSLIFVQLVLFSAVCNGECGSKHPHSQIYDEAQTTFTITG